MAGGKSAGVEWMGVAEFGRTKQGTNTGRSKGAAGRMGTRGLVVGLWAFWGPRLRVFSMATELGHGCWTLGTTATMFVATFVATFVAVFGGKGAGVELLLEAGSLTEVAGAIMTVPGDAEPVFGARGRTGLGLRC